MNLRENFQNNCNNIFKYQNDDKNCIRELNMETIGFTAALMCGLQSETETKIIFADEGGWEECVDCDQAVYYSEDQETTLFYLKGEQVGDLTTSQRATFQAVLKIDDKKYVCEGDDKHETFTWVEIS